MRVGIGSQGAAIASRPSQDSDRSATAFGSSARPAKRASALLGGRAIPVTFQLEAQASCRRRSCCSARTAITQPVARPCNEVHAPAGADQCRATPLGCASRCTRSRSCGDLATSPSRQDARSISTGIGPRPVAWPNRTTPRPSARAWAALPAAPLASSITSGRASADVASARSAAARWLAQGSLTAEQGQPTIVVRPAPMQCGDVCLEQGLTLGPGERAAMGMVDEQVRHQHAAPARRSRP